MPPCAVVFRMPQIEAVKPASLRLIIHEESEVLFPCDGGRSGEGFPRASIRDFFFFHLGLGGGSCDLAVLELLHEAILWIAPLYRLAILAHRGGGVLEIHVFPYEFVERKLHTGSKLILRHASRNQESHDKRDGLIYEREALPVANTVCVQVNVEAI